MPLPAPKKPRGQWYPKVTEPVRARWSGDKEFHCAIITVVVKEHQRYSVEFVASPEDQDAEREAATVDWEDIQRPFNLTTPPTHKNDDELKAWMTSNDVVCVDMKVSAKKRENGGNGCWLPAIVKEKTLDEHGETGFVVEFVQDDEEHTARLACTDINPLFTDMPLKYDAKGNDFYLSVNYTPPAFPAPPVLPYAGTFEDANFEEMPRPISNTHNFYGKQGYHSKVVDIDANGSHKHRSIIDWQNITMMSQTVGEVPRRSRKKITAQYNNMQGTLDTTDLPDEVLAIWTDDEGGMVEFLIPQIGVVWWQIKQDVGLWFKIAERESNAEHIFRMRSGWKYMASNLAKTMSCKLMAGRTEDSDYTEDLA